MGGAAKPRAAGLGEYAMILKITPGLTLAKICHDCGRTDGTHQATCPAQEFPSLVIEKQIEPPLNAKCAECKHWKGTQSTAAYWLDTGGFWGECPIAKHATRWDYLCDKWEEKS